MKNSDRRASCWSFEPHSEARRVAIARPGTLGGTGRPRGASGWSRACRPPRALASRWRSCWRCCASGRARARRTWPRRPRLEARGGPGDGASTASTPPAGRASRARWTLSGRPHRPWTGSWTPPPQPRRACRARTGATAWASPRRILPRPTPRWPRCSPWTTPRSPRSPPARGVGRWPRPPGTPGAGTASTLGPRTSSRRSRGKAWRGWTSGSPSWTRWTRCSSSV